MTILSKEPPSASTTVSIRLGKLHSVFRESREHVFNLLDHLGLGVTGSAVDIFLNHAPHIIIHEITIRGVRRPVAGAGEVEQII